MSAVRCDNTDCFWNHGTFCTRHCVILRGGICGVLVNKNGQQVNPELWTNPIIDYTEESHPEYLYGSENTENK